MSKWRRKTRVIEATQWFKNGDHPKDDCETFTDLDTGLPSQSEGKVVRYYRTPEIDGEDICKACGEPMHVHGWIDDGGQGYIVCPGDWILAQPQTPDQPYPVKPDIFLALYEPVHTEEEETKC